MRIAPAFAMSFLLLFAATSRAVEAPERTTGSHATELGCADCHPGTTEGSPFSGAIKDCDSCHDAKRNIHPIGIAPTTPIPSGFALSKDGRLLCRTCHKVHGGDPKTGMLSTAGNGYEKGRAAYCASCHGSENVRTNPHSARTGDSRCIFCHTETPVGKAQAVSNLRTKIVKLCDFCHGAVGKNHPRNIDPTLTIPAELPLPREADGSWNCATCHDPHGTVTTTHYVRSVFAKYMERGNEQKPHSSDYFVCRSCHTESTEKGIRVPGSSLRFRGDITILCISCHVTDRSHHPTGLEIPEAMKKRLESSPLMIPLSIDGRIDCYTCHDNQCVNGEFKMVERYYDSSQYRTDLCWACHDRDEYAKVNPHVTDIRTCTRCHDTRPMPGLDPSFMAVPLMVCLHCHDVKPHPVGKSHLAKPDGVKIKVDPSMPLSKTGEVTCVTCHEPHFDADEKPFRLRYKDPKAICGKCHWKG